MEDPCLHHHRAVVASVPACASPARGRRARRAPRRVAAGAPRSCLTPAHQFPLGGTLAPRAARGVRRVGARPRRPRVEDDYDGEFRYDRQPVGALQGLDPEHVVYAGTASKTLAPGAAARLARAARRACVEPVVEAKRAVGDTQRRSTSSRWPSSSAPARSTATSAACASATGAVATRCSPCSRARAPRVQARGIAAGLHVVLDLAPAGLREDEVIGPRGRALARPHAARARSGTPRPARAATGSWSGTPAAPEHAYGQALAVLGDVLAAG